MVMKWLNNNKDIKVMFVVLIVFLVGLLSYTAGRTQDNAPMMYEDEMIVPIDDFTALQQSVITLQEGMKLLLAGEPQSPELTTEQSQFMCMQSTEDYKDGFLEISTILTCMNLQLTE
jgi:biopolymer transport protein ExbD